MNNSLPAIRPDGSVVVSQNQAEFHRNSELAGILVGGPMILWAATRNRPLTTLEKVLLAVVGVSVFAIDLHLWNQFNGSEKEPDKS